MERWLLVVGSPPLNISTVDIYLINVYSIGEVLSLLSKKSKKRTTRKTPAEHFRVLYNIQIILVLDVIECPKWHKVIHGRKTVTNQKGKKQ